MANPIGTLTLFKRETKRFVKVYMQTIFAPVISNLLFLTIFGLSLNKAAISIEGVSYLEFIVPGLVIMGIINNAYQNPSSSIMIMKYQGLITDLLIIPLKKYEILIAMISSAVLRGLIVGAVTLAPASFFIDLTFYSVPLILLISILVALFFGLLGLLVGIWADEFDKTAFIQNFVMMPMIFLGGVFYPISTLPPFFQKLSSFNPIVYMVNLLRYGFTGINEFSLLVSFSVLGGGIILLTIVNYLILRSGWKLQT